MKKITKVLGVLVLAAGVFASCTKKDIEVPSNQLVGIWVDNANFANNSAQVKLLLPSKATRPVTVNLGTYQTTPSFGKQIPASLLNIPGSVVIAAGDSVATANIAVDPSSLEAGKYQAVVAITKADGADVLSNRSSVALNLIHGDIRPSVTLEASNEDYLGDEGELTVKVTGPFLHETPATVTLAVSSTSEVPAEALSFEPKVEIPANKGSVTVSVAIDRSKIDKGGLLEAVFEIASVSDNVIDASEKATFPVFTIIPEATSAWAGRYYGPYVSPQNGKSYDAFVIQGVTDANWNLVIKQKDDEAQPYDVLFAEQDAFEALCAKYTANTRAEILYYLYYSGNATPLLSPLSGGEYVGYIVGFDEDGFVTGNYATFEFEIENKDPLPAYAQWIGEWDLGDGAVISIAEDQVNKTYIIEGLELGIEKTTEYELGVTAEFDEETGGFTLSAQSLGTWTSDYGPATDKLCGLVQVEGETYYVDDPVVLATVTMSGEDKAFWTPGSIALGEEGAESLYVFTGIKYYWVVSAGAGRYSDGIVALPAVMTRVAPIDGGAVSSGLTRRPTMLPVGNGRRNSMNLAHDKKLEIR